LPNGACCRKMPQFQSIDIVNSRKKRVAALPSKIGEKLNFCDEWGTTTQRIVCPCFPTIERAGDPAPVVLIS